MKTLETALLLFASSIRAQTKGLGRYMESSIRLLVLFGERANGRVEGWVDARTSNENWPQQAPNHLPTNSQPAATFHYRPQCARRCWAPIFHHFAAKLVAAEDWVGVGRESKQLGPMAQLLRAFSDAPPPYTPPSPLPKSSPWNFSVSLISALPHFLVPRSVQARF